jgi:hypothetical protein
VGESAGERLSRAILAGLPVGVELDEREQALLAAAAKQADDVAALEANIAERGRVVDGRLNPAVLEARQGRTALGRLLSGLDLPDSRSFTAIRATKAARARWQEAS